MVYVNNYLLFIYYVYSMSSQNTIYNLKNVYTIYFNLCFNVLKILKYKMYFLALYYIILKNSILVTLQYNQKIVYSMGI